MGQSWSAEGLRVEGHGSVDIGHPATRCWSPGAAGPILPAPGGIMTSEDGEWLVMPIMRQRESCGRFFTPSLSRETRYCGRGCRPENLIRRYRAAFRRRRLIRWLTHPDR